uniref:Ig-like domain-containing protein n=1 Tax=Scleropages formosus TaxID=113540 RepID=A0A8C9VY34_SCLFO
MNKVKSSLVVLFLSIADLLHGLALVERRQLTAMKGRSITLEAGTAELRRDSHVVWLFGSPEPTTVMAALFDGRSSTDYSDRFGDRLQLDTRTVSLTLSNLSTGDTGIYQLKLLKGDLPVATFTLSVYEVEMLRFFSRPCICSVLCSVENDRDVTLSWTRGKEILNQTREMEILNQTSSPHLNTTLSLRLDIDIERHPETYYCEVKNPVSSEHLRVDSKEDCTPTPGGHLDFIHGQKAGITGVNFIASGLFTMRLRLWLLLQFQLGVSVMTETDRQPIYMDLP